jgi:hypothetical protein
MALDLHTVSMNPASDLLAMGDRVHLAKLTVANVIGGGAGAAVTVPVVMTLPASYTVQATPSQDATVWISAKTQAGFTVNIAPRLAASTLAVGTVDLVVLA